MDQVSSDLVNAAKALALNIGALTQVVDNTSTQIQTEVPISGSTSALQNFVGDAGSGGKSGLVPAPPAGSAAVGDYLKADGTWSVPPGGSALPGGITGQVQWNNAGGFAGFTVSGDATLNTATGALTVTKTSGISFGSLATLSNINNSNWSGTALSPSNGGTGVSNNAANTITFTGNYALALTLSAATSLTLPTSGTVATTSQIPTSLPPNGAASGDLSGTYPSPTVAKIGGNAVSLGGSLSFSGAFAFTGTLTGATTVTFPTSGTLATTTQLPADFAGSAHGLVPASVGGTLNFLRADGSWAAPSGSGGTVTTSGSPAQYQLAVMAGPTSITGIATGTTSQVLVGGGASANPSWGSVPAAALPISKGTFTLTANATSTTVTVIGATGTSSFLGTPTPTTQDAANDMATTSYVMGTGQFVVTHANNTRVDRTFSYVVLL